MLKLSSRACAWAILFALALGLAKTPAQTSTNSARWEPEISAFEAVDRTNPPPRNAILFIGSSAFRLWETMARDFPGKQVINRCFDGSEIPDSTAFAERIIFPYHPRMILLYAGDNDLARGRTPDQVVADYMNLVRTVQARLPQTRIAFVSIKPSLARWEFKEEIIEVNRRVAAIKGDGLVFIDVFSLMLGPDGNPREDLFLPDRLHPNEKGYELWASLIKPYLN